MLEKYGFEPHDRTKFNHWVRSIKTKKLETLSPRLMQIEGTASKNYFSQSLLKYNHIFVRGVSLIRFILFTKDVFNRK